MENQQLIVILGPTASGKTAKAVNLAKYSNGEILSADSRQVYREMNIGTGKDLCEYDGVPYHLIDICNAGYKYNLFEYVRDFNSEYNEIKKSNKQAIMCGGTGLYIETILKGIKLPDVPENKDLRSRLSGKTLLELTSILSKYKKLHNTTDIDTAKRAIRAIEIQEYYQMHSNQDDLLAPEPINDALIIGLDIDRETRRKRISQRLQSRIKEGMIDEVQKLLEKIPAEDLIYYGLEYKFITLYLINKITYAEMVSQLEIAIHQFAKRQMTWFRGMERRGFKINWLPYDMPNTDFISYVDKYKLQD